MPTKRWTRGDRVMHPNRPEWGAGEVLSAQAATIEGKVCQRLSVRFERGGLKTLSTAVAELAEATQPSAVATLPATDPFEGLDDDAPSYKELLRTLPEPATDPFRSVLARFNETCRLYRFTDAPASVFDWAAAQTGLTDPLTQFSRHELEEAFRRFQRLRDDHFFDLLRTLRKESPADLSSALAAAPQEAQRLAARAQR